MPGFEIIDKKEQKAVEEIFTKNNGILFAHGFDSLRKNFHVREFEKKINIRFKSKYSLAVSSGTAAIKIALKALGVERGDEVITQAFNFIATIEAILDVGARPIICPIDDTLNLDPKKLSALITKKTKVVIPVHMLGVPCDMRPIINICRKKKIKILEDNCEAVGSTYENKKCGLLGDVGIFSLDFGKIITCGEGGVIVTNDKKIFDYSKAYHDHGHENNKNFSRGNDTRKIYGFNYRLTELQGAIAKVQLLKLNHIIKNNKVRYNFLRKMLKNNFKIRRIPKNCSPIFDTFIFYEKDQRKKKEILEILKKNKIGTKNLPDAIKWHCSYYWDHALSKKEVMKSSSSKNLLKNYIAIPILLKVSLRKYNFLIKQLLNV